MKKIIVLLSVALLLAACNKEESKNNKKSDDTDTNPTSFKKNMENNLTYSLKVQYLTDEKVLQDTSNEGKITNNKSIRVTATVTNNTDNDYTFGGNPCSGKLSISIQKNGDKLKGDGDTTPDFCIEPYVEHTIKSGEIITSTADYSLDSTKTGIYEVISVYNNQHFKNEIEIVEE